MTDLVLRLRITGDGSGVVGVVQGAEDAVKRLGNQAQRTQSEVSRLNSESSNLSRTFASLASLIPLAAFSAAAKSVLDYADSLKTISLEIGVSTTALQEMRHAIALTGGTLDDLTTALRKQSTMVQEASEGTKKAAEFFNKLNLSAEKLKQISPDLQMQKIGEAILGMTNETERNAAAIEAWGRAGTKQLALMRDHGTALADVREEAHKMGLVMSTETVDALDALGDKAGETWQAWKVGVGELVASITGPLMGALDAFATYPSALKAAWGDFWSWMTRQTQSAAQGIASEEAEIVRVQQNNLKGLQDRALSIVMGASNANRYMVQSETDEVAAIGKQVAAIQEEIAVRNKSIDATIATGRAQAEHTEATQKLTVATKAFNVSGQNAIATTEKHGKAMSEVEKSAKAFATELSRVLDATIPEQKILGDLNHQMSILDQALAQGAISWETYSQAVLNATDMADKALNKDMAKAASDASKEQEKAAKAFETAWEESIKRVDNFFVDLWKGLISGTSSAIDTIKNLFVQMLSELAHAAITRPIMLQIATSMGMPAAAGTAAQVAGGGLGGAVPYGSMLNTAANFIGINPASYVNWLSNASGIGYGTGFGSQQSLMLAGQEAGMTGFGGTGGIGMGTVLGGIGAGIGGWGIGGMMAGLTGGNQLGGNIGGAIGGIAGSVAAPAISAAAGIAVGAAWGSVVPIVGTIIGAVLGGLLGSLIGGGNKPNPFNVSLATGKEFPVRGTIKGYEDYSSVTGPLGEIGFILRGNNDAFDAASESSKKFLEGIAQIDTAFAQYLDPAETAAVKKRLSEMSEVEFKDEFSAITALKQRFEEMLDAVDPKLKQVYDSFEITADNAGSFAVALLDIRKHIADLNATIAASGPQDPVRQFTDNIAALDAALSSAAESGRKALEGGDPTKVTAAAQALEQAITARYQYEMQMATQLQQVIEGLAAGIAQLKQQVYDLRVSFYKDFLDINQRIQSTGGSGTTQIDIWRAAGTELLGAYSGETDPQRRLGMLRQGVDIVDQGLAAALADVDAWVQAEADRRQGQVDDLNKQKAEIQAAAQTRIDALSIEKTKIQDAAQARVDSLNKELALAQQWSSILSGATSALDSMKYGGVNPLSAFARLQSAQTELSGAADPERRLQLLQTLGSLGGEAYQRPSPEYQRIYNQVVYGLTQLQDEAQAQAAHAADLQEQIASAGTASSESLSSIDLQIEQVTKSAKAQTEAIDLQVARLEDMTAIDKRAEWMRDQARAEANSYYQWIEREGAKAYADIQDILAGQISANQAALDIARGQMDALTQGLGYQQFMVQQQSQMVLLLTAISNALGDFVTGSAPGTTKMGKAFVQAQITPAQIKPLIPYIQKAILTA